MSRVDGGGNQLHPKSPSDNTEEEEVLSSPLRVAPTTDADGNETPRRQKRNEYYMEFYPYTERCCACDCRSTEKTLLTCADPQCNHDTCTDCLTSWMSMELCPGCYDKASEDRGKGKGHRMTPPQEEDETVSTSNAATDPTVDQKISTNEARQASHDSVPGLESTTPPTTTGTDVEDRSAPHTGAP